MNHSKRTFALVGLVGAMALSATSYAVSNSPQAGVGLATTISPSRLTIGDRAQVVLDLALPIPRNTGEKFEALASPRFPDWRETWGDAEILSVSPVERVDQGGAIHFRQTVELAAYRTGRVELPPVQIVVPFPGGDGGEGSDGRTVHVATRADLALEISSILPSDPNDPNRKAKPPQSARSLPWGSPFWWTAGTLGAAVLGLGLALLRRQKAPTGATAPLAPLLPRLHELEAALAAAVDDPSLGRTHELLSRAFRRYLTRALDFAATERTTSEIHRDLVARKVPTPATRGAIDALRACDLVKFARRPTSRERAEEIAAALLAVAGSIERQVDGTATQPAPLLPPARKREHQEPRNAA